MENLGLLIYGGVCVLGAYVCYLVYKKYECPKCGKFAWFCKCK